MKTWASLWGNITNYLLPGLEKEIFWPLWYKIMKLSTSHAVSLWKFSRCEDAQELQKITNHTRSAKWAPAKRCRCPSPVHPPLTTNFQIIAQQSSVPNFDCCLFYSSFNDFRSFFSRKPPSISEVRTKQMLKREYKKLGPLRYSLSRLKKL